MRIWIAPLLIATWVGTTWAQDASPDAGPPDLVSADTTPAGDVSIPTTCQDAIGKHCMTATDCGTQATCLTISQTKGGICTCTCTPDDPNTPLVNEDSCPELNNNVCGQIDVSTGGTMAFCMRLCQPKLGSNDCEAPISCHPRSGSFIGSVDTAVCLALGCEADTDCPVITGQACDTSNPTCGAGETCLALDENTTIGVCTTPGKCDKASGLCDKHPTNKPNAKVGDPCKGDLDCSEYQDCQIEFDPKTLGRKDHGATCSQDSDCCGQCSFNLCQGACAVHARNGYCSVRGCTFATPTAYNEFACPTGSSCNSLFFGGICMKNCALSSATDCRGNPADEFGDYECRAWNNLATGGTAITDKPVCDFGDVGRCSLFASIPSLDCSSLGEQGNPTNMSCRKLDNTKTANPKDPLGFCLDDTPSGPAPKPPGVDAGLDGSLDAAPDTWPAYPDFGMPEASGGDDPAYINDSGLPQKSGGGCACRVSSGTDGDAGSALLTMLALLALVSRRRR